MSTILVQSSPGTRTPMEGAPRDYIDDKTPREVPATTYYARLLTDGSLVQVAPASAPAPATETETPAASGDASILDEETFDPPQKKRKR